MSELIAKKVRSLLPGVPVGRKPVAKRGRAVIVTSSPAAIGALKRAEKVTLTFLAETYAEAKRMYMAVRHAIVSVGDEATLGEGGEAIVVRELDGASAGYVAGCALYRLTAKFSAIGY